MRGANRGGEEARLVPLVPLYPDSCEDNMGIRDVGSFMNDTF